MLAPSATERATRHLALVALSGARRRYAVRCPGRASYLAGSIEEAHLVQQLLNLADAPPCAGRFDEIGPGNEPCQGVAHVTQQRTPGPYPRLPGHCDGYCTPCARRLWLPPWDS